MPSIVYRRAILQDQIQYKMEITSKWVQNVWLGDTWLFVRIKCTAKDTLSDTIGAEIDNMDKK